MLRILAMIVIPVAVVACSQPRFIVRAGLDSINPTLAGPTGPMPLIAPPGAKPEPKASSPDAGQHKSSSGGAAVDRLPSGVIQSPENSFGTARTMSMVPASGDQRSRLVRSATRLVGIVKSFDSRSFLGHLLAICDLLPGGRTSVDWSATDHMDQARAAGMLREAPGPAVPGDIVFFRCPSGCGADTIDGIGAGVVVESEGARTAFIAYRDGQVGRFDVAADELIGYCAP